MKPGPIFSGMITGKGRRIIAADPEGLGIPERIPRKRTHVFL